MIMFWLINWVSINIFLKASSSSLFLCRRGMQFVEFELLGLHAINLKLLVLCF